MSKETELKNLFHRGYLWQATGDTPAYEPNACATSARDLACFGIDDIDCTLPAGGLRYGALHEFFIDSIDAQDPLRSYLKPHALILQLLRNNLKSYFQDVPSNSFSSRYQKKTFDKYIAWIGKDFFPYPGAIEQFLRFQTADGDISFAERCVFLRPEDNPGLLSCVEAALQSNALPIIVAMCPELSLSASKRLSMLAEKHHSLLFLYRPLSAEKQKSFASSRWKILPYASKYQQLAWTLELLQSKGKKTIHNSWIIAQQAHTRFSLLEHDEVDDGHVSLHLLSPMAPAIRREARHAAAS